MLLSLLGPAPAAALEIELLGISGLMAENVRARNGLFRLAERETTSPAVEAFFRRRLPGDVARALEPFGFYQPVVEITREAPDRLVVSVDPGPPVLLRRVEVRLLQGGEAFDAPFPAPGFPLAPGDRLDHRLYEDGKRALRDALLDAGFLDARAITHRVSVDPAAHTADLELAFEAGERHSFGPVHFEGAQFPDHFMARYLPFAPGEPYSQDRLLELGSRLRDSGYFQQVSVLPELDRPGTAVPVNVRVAPAALTFYSAAFLWGTDTGPGVELELRRRWLNERGHNARITLDLARRRQIAGLSYDIPSPGRYDAFYQLSASANREERDSFESEALRLRASRFHSSWGWNRVDTVEVLREVSDFGSEEVTVESLIASVGMSRTRSEGGVVPTRGYSLRGTLSAGANPAYLRGIFRARRILTLGENWRTHLRAGFGVLSTDSFDDLPASARFFAGGDRSVRGYDFESLGPLNEAGDVVGGSYLLEASAELERRVRGPWRAAVFVDAGDAQNRLDADLEVGAGLGLRYETPVGLIRLDVGVPVTRDDLDPRLHLIVGPDL